MRGIVKYNSLLYYRKAILLILISSVEQAPKHRCNDVEILAISCNVLGRSGESGDGAPLVA